MHKGTSPDILPKASAACSLFGAHVWGSLALSAVLGRLLDGASAKRCCVSTAFSRPLHRPCSLRARPSKALAATIAPTHVLVQGRLQIKVPVQQLLLNVKLAAPVDSFVLRVARWQDACYCLQLCKEPLQACIGIRRPRRI